MEWEEENGAVIWDCLEVLIGRDNMLRLVKKRRVIPTLANPLEIKVVSTKKC